MDCSRATSGSFHCLAYLLPQSTPQAVNSVSASDLRRMAMACGKAQCFDGELLEARTLEIDDVRNTFKKAHGM